MVRSTKPSLLRRFGALVAAAAMLVVLPAGVSTASAASDDADMLTVTMTRTDALGDEVYVGDTLTYSFTNTNNTSSAFTAFPAESNLSGVLTTGTPNCRYENLAGGASYPCSTASHTITADDLTAGSFTPRTVWKATSDRGGTQVLQDNIVSTGDTVTVKEGKRPDPATIPTDRADGEAVRLATARQNLGTECYRIPALAEAPNGWILAAFDQRPNTAMANGSGVKCWDAPQPNSIVQRISKDGGKSWTPIQYVAQGKNAPERYGYSDPSYVVDEETGEVFLFFVHSYNKGFADSQLGVDESNRNVLHAVVVSSKDNGETWSKPRDITADITKGYENEWKSRFATSGAGIQLKYGKYKGRLIQQYAVGRTTGSNAAVSVYSDDHGKTWQAGNPVTGMLMDENKVVELSDGRVMLNSRPGNGSGYRRVAISKDGGVNYGTVKNETQLPDPNNNAHITRAFPNAPEGSAKAKVLLYSSPRANNEGRANGVVRISLDDGTTWSSGKLYKAGSMAYSVITALSGAAGGGYGLLYEGAWVTGGGIDSHDIMYTHISMDWLGYLSATADDVTASVEEGASTVDVTVPVSNIGSVDYTGVTVTPADLPTGWSASPVNVGALASGASKDVTVTVNVPATAKKDDVAKIVLRVTGTSAANADATTGFDGSITVNVTEKSEPDPEPEPTITGVSAVTSQAGVKVGDVFDASKVSVTAAMSDGSSKALAAGEYSLSAVDADGKAVDLAEPFAAAGVVTVTVSVPVEGANPLTASFTIDVAEKSVDPEPKPEPKPEPEKPAGPKVDVPTEQPGLSKTGASTAGMSIVFVLFALSGVAALSLRRRSAH